MKNIFTKCLVLSALTIGMSSTVMAEEEAVKATKKGDYTPIGFEITEGDNNAHALLLLGKKGDVNGLICYSSLATALDSDNCHRVKGQITQHDGSKVIELVGKEIKHSGIWQTDTIIVEHTVAIPSFEMATVTKPLSGTISDKGNTLYAQAIPTHVTYTGGLFTFVSDKGAALTVPYTPATYNHVYYQGPTGY